MPRRFAEAAFAGEFADDTSELRELVAPVRRAGSACPVQGPGACGGGAPDGLPLRAHVRWPYRPRPVRRVGRVDVEAIDPWNVPGRYGWVGGTGTTAHLTPSPGTVTVLLTQLERAGPTPPAVMREFWRYAAGT